LGFEKLKIPSLAGDTILPVVQNRADREIQLVSHDAEVFWAFFA
jgi:hypothetical protein